MDDKTKQQKLDKLGQPLYEIAFGVAYAKNDPEWPALRQAFKNADAAAWPQYHDPVTKEIRAGVVFADKIIDGDGYDSKGNHRALKDGHAGHWIVKYTTQFPPTIHMHNGRQWVQVTDPKAIKCGDYIRVDGSTQSNQSTQSPGMYRNPNMVAFYGHGLPIVAQGADPSAKFGAEAPILPPGASATPLSPPGAPVAPPPGAPTVPAPATPLPPAVPAAPAAPPYTGYMQTPAAPAPAPVAPPAPPPPAVPAAPAAPQYAVTRGDATYNAYIAAGWKDEQLIQQGLMEDWIPF